MSKPVIAAAGDSDNTVIMLQFTNGVIGTISNSRHAVYGYDQRVELLGSAGAISTGNNYPNTAIISDARSVRRDLPLYFFVERYAETFLSALAASVNAVLHDPPFPFT